MAAWSARNEEDDVIEARQRRHRHLSTRIDPDGTVCGSFRLPPLAGGKLLAAVNTTMMRSTAKRQPDGTWPTGSTVDRQLPDVFMRALIHDSNRRPVDATNRRRFPTPRQMRLVKARDKACVDCGRRDLLVYDHVPPFEASGHTSTAELELRCSPCHTKRHDQHDRSAHSLVRRPGLEGAAPA
ncbi:MAG: HNH endonuclease [Acidimicrobiales bacterium]